MKRHFKFCLCLLYLVLCCCLTSCNRHSKRTTQQTLEKPTVKYHIGLCQINTDRYDETLVQGFQTALEKKLPDAQITYVTKNIAENPNTLTDQYLEWEQAGLDLIFVANTDNSIPIDITVNQTPVITTPTYDVTELAADTLCQLLPDIQQVGILYHSTDEVSKAKTDTLIQYLEQKNISYQKYPAMDTTSLSSGANDICDQCDAAYIPSDALTINQVPQLKDIFLPAGIPLVSDHQAMQDTSIATAGIQYHDLGYRLGKMAADVLQTGKQPDLSTINISDYIHTSYNQQLCEYFDIPIPAETSPAGNES